MVAVNLPTASHAVSDIGHGFIFVHSNLVPTNLLGNREAWENDIGLPW
jgi:hypothetical protein